MTTEDEAILAQQDFWTLATWWGVLNCWGWPVELPNPEGCEYKADGRRAQLMRWIEEAVGLRACFRCSKPWRHETEGDFTDFWRGTFEQHEPSRARYRKRLEDMCKQETPNPPAAGGGK